MELGGISNSNLSKKAVQKRLFTFGSGSGGWGGDGTNSHLDKYHLNLEGTSNK